MLDLELLQKIFDRGLTQGLGTADQTCIEGAISIANGEPFSDRPSCVATADRQFAIYLNDANWSSPSARSAALFPLALAQIETAGRNRERWAALLAEGIIRRVLPLALEAAAVAFPAHADALRAAAKRCREEGAAAASNAVAVAGAAANAVTRPEIYPIVDAAEDAAVYAESAANFRAFGDSSTYSAHAAGSAADAVPDPDLVLIAAVDAALAAYAADADR